MPGVGGTYFNHPSTIRHHGAQSANAQLPSNEGLDDRQDRIYQQQQPPAAPYNLYPQASNSSQLQPNYMQEPIIPFNPEGQPSEQNVPGSIVQPANATPNSLRPPYSGAFFDPSDPALFNFDLASMNFGNHYGALEFGMLGHMATGVGETPPSDQQTHRGSIGHVNGTSQLPTPATGSNSYTESPATHSYMFQDPNLNDWQTGQSLLPNQINSGALYGNQNQNMLSGQNRRNPDIPHAYAIEAGPGSFASPDSLASPQNMMNNAEDSNNFSNFGGSGLGSQSQARQAGHDRQNHQQAQSRITTPRLKSHSLPVKRPRDPSTIYDSVKSPYSYTTGFHGLTAFLQRRFPPQKTLRIAKALASIRPSFISCTKTLNRDDLIFMEKCFQRTLWEYEDFINACGTPTIVCRRTGEVAAVGKEFSILTGWKKDVLLGKEPNLNVNTGNSSGQPGTGYSSRGLSTPRMPAAEGTENGSRPQPVFLAELLDDESVIQFYEDFARLAFGDSRGSVTTRCKLLKYKTKGDLAVTKQANDGTRGQGRNFGGNTTNGKDSISGEAGINQLGFMDGKVDCSYCWTVKRDVFDIPMMIVMNVSPKKRSQLKRCRIGANGFDSSYLAYEASLFRIDDHSPNQ